MIAILGALPEKPVFSAVEFHSADKVADYRTKYPELADKQIVICSDTHYLPELPDAINRLELEGDTPDTVRRSLITYLKSG